jgi:hypothetical protein
VVANGTDEGYGAIDSGWHRKMNDVAVSLQQLSRVPSTESNHS